VCQGCKKTGNEKPRGKKDDLCCDCYDIFNAGVVSTKESNQGYTSIFVHINAKYHRKTIDWVYKVLTFLHTPEGNITVSSPYLYDKLGYIGSNGENFVVRYDVLREILPLIDEVEEFFRDKDVAIKTTIKTLNESLLAAKNDIYNQGVERGKNLLLGLEAGTISMEDFANNCFSYPLTPR
jgi:hypothetical protein